MKRNLLRYSFVVFYTVAGIMHFIQPDVYLEVIPDWMCYKSLINYTAGFVELLVAVMACFKLSQQLASYITIAMLLAFTISHIYFIQMGSCAGDFCIPEWIAWIRLIVIHPLLIWWAWKIRKA